jgi:PAS domain S-box-containing protein
MPVHKSRPRADFGSLIANAPFALVVVDEGGRALELNRAAESILGIGRAAAVGHPISELVGPATVRAAHQAGLAQTTESGYDWNVGQRIAFNALSPSGDELPIEVTVVPLGETGRQYALWIRDVSIRRRWAARFARLEATLAQAEQLASFGIWEWDRGNDGLWWSDNCYRLYDLAPGELEPTTEYVLTHTHPADLEQLRQALRTVARTGERTELEYRIALEDGTVRHVRTTIAVAAREAADPRHLIGIVHDITEGHRSAQEIAAHVAVIEALTSWETFQPGATNLLRRLAEAMEFELGVLLVPLDDELVPRAAWHRGLPGDPLRALPSLRLRRGVGIAGQAWELGEPVTLSDAHLQTHYEFREAALRAGVRGGLAFPVVHRDELLAVLGFGATEPTDLNERLISSLTGIGYELGFFFDRHRAELRESLLTARELDVLRLAAQGLTVKEIAAELAIHQSTVKTHLEHIYRKLDASDRAAAVAQALRQGLIE